jgi:nitrite reductase/ring-hydroxylating ferredoxin subunit
VARILSSMRTGTKDSNSPSNRLLARRSFLASCGACLLCSVTSLTGCRAGETKVRSPIGLGKASSVPYGRSYRQTERLVLVRDQSGIAAGSLLCTHATCLLEATQSELICPCHGSRFSLDGIVLQGPAERNLPWYRLRLTESGELMVLFDQLVDASWRLEFVS